MNKRAGSLPPITLCFVAVALATAAVLLPHLSGNFPARLSSIHVSAADVAFSAVLAVGWLYAASSLRVCGARMSWSSIARIFRYCGPVVAVFALYMVAFHPNVSAFRTTAFLLLCMCLCESLRLLFRGMSHPASRRALVLGTGKVASTVWRDLRTGRLPEMSFAGFTGEKFREEFCPDIAARYVGNFCDLKEIVFRQGVDDLIIAMPATEGSRQTEHAVEIAANLGVRVWTVRQALGLPVCPTKDAAAEYIELVSDPELSAIRSAVKRSLDVIIAASALVAGLPIPALMFVSEGAGGRHIRFECQTRVGLHRRLFRIHRVDSPLRIDGLRELMNKYLLMWNVLLGDMSMVGPRAYSPEELSRRDIPESAGRFGIRPGLTGGRELEACCDSALSTRGHRGDYGECWSLTGDLKVLARAVRGSVRRTVATHAGTGGL
jgi:exopolysaccharide production protein ExoY